MNSCARRRRGATVQTAGSEFLGLAVLRAGRFAAVTPGATPGYWALTPMACTHSPPPLCHPSRSMGTSVRWGSARSQRRRVSASMCGAKWPPALRPTYCWSWASTHGAVKELWSRVRRPVAQQHCYRAEERPSSAGAIFWLRRGRKLRSKMDLKVILSWVHFFRPRRGAGSCRRL